MKRILSILGFLPIFFVFTSPAFAVDSAITNYTSNTINMITAIATAAAVFFLVKGGYLYITSSGKPDSLESAKRTIKNALIGLVLVLASGLLVSIFTNALGSSSNGATTSAISITPIESVQPLGGLTVVLTDAISGVVQLIITSAAKPIMDGVIGYLTTTPSLLDNKVIMNFWLIILGITDSLFVVVIALMGLKFMSSEALGFGETELKHLLPRIGLAFLGANVSLFLADYAIQTCNVLVTAVLNSTGGLSKSLLADAINPVTTITNTTPFITIIFLLLFLIVSIVLLFMYITRLIFISLGAVLSPLVFLLWTLPKFSDMAEIAVKSYLVTVFMIFIQVVVIQLASAFLTLPTQGNNSLVSIAVGIGLLFSLLKIPQVLMQMVFYTSSVRSLGKMGGHLINVMTTDNSSSASRAEAGNRAVKTPRKVVNA
ncbi:MAG: hypothetical protein Q7R49_00095 [Candidatus Daviesbacteria bacterium]|nr:hypothetical protein [Candidatus Daviesbacteria bacterium]